MAWADLPADVLGGVIAQLPFPGDRARICAVCQAWRSAALHHDGIMSHSPWIVLPDCSFCTTGGGHDDGGAFFGRIPGLPADNVTCLGAAAACWLALDVTDDALRRTSIWDHYCPDTGTFAGDARPDVKHAHAYMLHNPFSGETVPLPELDAIVGDVAETFQIRKVLMRSDSPEDVVAVTTNNWNYNVIVCRPGKGAHVLPYYRVIDVAFVGDTLYGITSGEELLAFHLGEDDDGKPNVTSFKRVISNPLAKYYKEFSWGWPGDSDDGDDDDATTNADDDHDHYYRNNNNGDGELSIISNDEESDDDDGSPSQKENEEESDDDEEEEQVEDSINGDDMVSNNEEKEYDEEVPYEPKDEIYTGRYLVQSRSGELLLVRHQRQSPPYSEPYTRNVEVFKADVSAGKWVVATDDGLDEGEALFLSRSFSKSTRAVGDIEDGFVYYAAEASLQDAFDTRSWTIREIAFERPWQWRRASDELVTWLFPPDIVV